MCCIVVDAVSCLMCVDAAFCTNVLLCNALLLCNDLLNKERKMKMSESGFFSPLPSLPPGGWGGVGWSSTRRPRSGLLQDGTNDDSSHQKHVSS